MIGLTYSINVSMPWNDETMENIVFCMLKVMFTSWIVFYYTGIDPFHKDTKWVMYTCVFEMACIMNFKYENAKHVLGCNF